LIEGFTCRVPCRFQMFTIVLRIIRGPSRKLSIEMASAKWRAFFALLHQQGVKMSFSALAGCSFNVSVISHASFFLEIALVIGFPFDKPIWYRSFRPS
jgi:hypothetical protein